MADILNIGTSALLSLQRAINTTGHNIANVNTDGYSRQQVDFDTLPPQRTGAGFIGSGVTVSTVTRSYDQYLTADVRSRTSSSLGYETFRELSSRVDNLLADPSVGLGPALEGFFGAIADVANNPGSMPERQVLIGEAQILAERFHYLEDRFRGLDQEVNARIENTVEDINSLASSIAQLNEQIVRVSAQAGGQPPNDLLDTRDQLITRLAERVGVTTVEQEDGAINVLAGNGQALVVGFTTQQLETFTDPFDSTRVNVGVAGLAAQTDIGRFLSGGQLGAALDFRSQVLDGSRSELGLIATGVTETFNQQHRLGLDLNGQLGGDFFQPLVPTVVASISNPGAATVTASITDATALTGDSYSLTFDGAIWTLRNDNTGSSQTGAGPFTVDGVDIAVAGAPLDGDAFVIEPTGQGANLFNVVLTDPAAFAAASPLRSQTSLANVGSARLDNLAVTDASGLPLATSVTLTFNPDALGAGVPGYDVAGIAGGPIAYDPTTQSNGIQASLGGFEFTLAGVPQAGDNFIVDNNTGGSGDNRNALALGVLQTAATLDNGTSSYQDSYASLVAGVAVQSRQASSAADTESVLLNQAIAARDSTQGVNLDEEAANLIRYQQAYQAAAQVISIADNLFQTLINATGNR